MIQSTEDFLYSVRNLGSIFVFLQSDKGFKMLLGYINTEKAKQKKR